MVSSTQFSQSMWPHVADTDTRYRISHFMAQYYDGHQLKIAKENSLKVIGEM